MKEIDDYLESISGKQSYVWDPNSMFGNKYRVRVTLEGENAHLGMQRPIAAVIVIFDTNKPKHKARNLVSLPVVKSLQAVLREINIIVRFAENEIKKKMKVEVAKVNEVILVPEEHYHKFFCKKNNHENDLYRAMGIPIPTYWFYLSEINATDKEIAYLVELTRSVHHILTLIKLLELTDTEYIQDENLRAQIEVQFDYPRVYIFTMMASHLREALKLFWKFMDETEIYAEIERHLLKTQKENLEEIIKIIKEYDEKKGFLYETLKFVRNQMFHYLPDKAEKWVKKIKKEEKEEKPHYHSINFEPLEMGLGAEFEQFIYSDKFFFSPEKGLKFFEFKKLIDVQKQLISIVKGVIEYIMNKSGIESYRPSDWFLKYRYGYKK